MGAASIMSEWVESLQSRGYYTFTRERAESESGRSFIATQSALRRLKEKGRIVSPRRGFYVVVPPEYRASSPCRMGVLFNRVPAIPETHRSTLEQAGLTILGHLPPDDAVSLADATGGALHDLAAESITYAGLKRILQESRICMDATTTTRT